MSLGIEMESEAVESESVESEALESEAVGISPSALILSEKTEQVKKKKSRED